MQKELDLLLNIIDGCHTVAIDSLEFYRGKVGGTEVVAMTCGIGKVNAAMGALTMIKSFAPEAVINSGVAGGTGRGAEILDVVLASAVAYHDVWCGPGTEWGQAAGCPKLFDCPADAAALAAALGVKTGLVASGDIFVSRPEDVERILALYPQAVAVDMESAAVAQVCFTQHVPMYCLRVMSDTPGAADNIAQYETFWTDAPQHTFEAVKKLISIISNNVKNEEDR